MPRLRRRHVRSAGLEAGRNAGGPAGRRGAFLQGDLKHRLVQECRTGGPPDGFGVNVTAPHLHRLNGFLVAAPPSLAVNRSSSTDRFAYWATATAYACSGVLLSTWMARIASVKEATRLDAGMFGTLLTMSVLGCLGFMQLGGHLAARIGARAVLRIAVPCLAVALYALSLARDGIQLALLLLCFGFTDGLLTVGISMTGVAVEKLLGRPCLNSFHASWSIGALTGAFLSGVFIWFGWDASNHFFVVGLVTIAGSYPLLRKIPERAARSAPTAGERQAHSWRSGWSGRVFALGMLGLCCLVAQGGLADWGAIFLREERNASYFVATVGYISFCTAIVLGRLAGDRLVIRFGPTRLLRAFAFLAAVGIAITLAVPAPMWSVGGLIFSGLGLSILHPVVSSTAGRSAADGQVRYEAEVAVAHITTLSHIGLLLGPPLIGWLAEWLGIQWALTLPGLAALTVGGAAAFVTRSVLPAGQDPTAGGS
ncbi:MFS transporter [Streptomyces sp. NPDC088270]|uniref:MFS transporter n=1 Tax=Streptomyces sp. NPDC088270 TaxID=3160990 RepID=UPI0034477E70